MSDLRPELPETKPELPEEPLTLTHSKCDTPLHFHKLREGLSIPEIGAQSDIRRTLPKGLANLFQLLFAESSWSTRSLSFGKTRKAIHFKPTHPISYRSRGVSKESCNLSAAQALSHKKNSVQSVAVTRFVRTPDFILKGEHHLFRIGGLGFSHGGTDIPP
jgi:hypothetical protein